MKAVTDQPPPSSDQKSRATATRSRPSTPRKPTRATLVYRSREKPRGSGRGGIALRPVSKQPRYGTTRSRFARRPPHARVLLVRAGDQRVAVRLSRGRTAGGDPLQLSLAFDAPIARLRRRHVRERVTKSEPVSLGGVGPTQRNERQVH